MSPMMLPVAVSKVAYSIVWRIRTLQCSILRSSQSNRMDAAFKVSLFCILRRIIISRNMISSESPRMPPPSIYSNELKSVARCANVFATAHLAIAASIRTAEASRSREPGDAITTVSRRKRRMKGYPSGCLSRLLSLLCPSAMHKLGSGFRV